jgi:hypothetical protein
LSPTKGDASAILIRIEREIGSIESEAQKYEFVISGDLLEARRSS